MLQDNVRMSHTSGSDYGGKRKFKWQMVRREDPILCYSCSVVELDRAIPNFNSSFYQGMLVYLSINKFQWVTK